MEKEKIKELKEALQNCSSYKLDFDDDLDVLGTIGVSNESGSDLKLYTEDVCNKFIEIAKSFGLVPADNTNAYERSFGGVDYDGYYFDLYFTQENGSLYS